MGTALSTSSLKYQNITDWMEGNSKWFYQKGATNDCYCEDVITLTKTSGTGKDDYVMVSQVGIQPDYEYNEWTAEGRQSYINGNYVSARMFFNPCLKVAARWTNNSDGTEGGDPNNTQLFFRREIAAKVYVDNTYFGRVNYFGYMSELRPGASDDGYLWYAHQQKFNNYPGKGNIYYDFPINSALTNAARNHHVKVEIWHANGHTDTLVQLLGTYEGDFTLDTQILYNMSNLMITRNKTAVTMAVEDSDANKLITSVTAPDCLGYNINFYYKNKPSVTIEDASHRGTAATQYVKQMAKNFNSKDELILGAASNIYCCELTFSKYQDYEYYCYIEPKINDSDYVDTRKKTMELCTVSIDPNYTVRNVTVGTTEVQVTTGAHSYPASWGAIQNHSSLYVSSITADIPVTRTGNVLFQVTDTVSGQSIQLLLQTIGADIVNSAPMQGSSYRRITVAALTIPLSLGGSNTLTFSFTDSGNQVRGGTTGEGSIQQTVVPYSAPTINIMEIFRAWRVGSAGTIQEKVDSKNIAYTLGWTISSLNNHNTTTVRKVDVSLDNVLKHTIQAASINNGVQTYYTSFTFDTERSYKMVFTITDALNYTAMATFILPPAQVFLDFKAGGKGMGIGKVAETDQLEVQFDADFYGNVNFRGQVSGINIAAEENPEFTTLRVTNSATINEATFNGDVQFNGNVYGLPGGAKVGTDYNNGIGSSWCQISYNGYTKVDIDYDYEKTGLTAAEVTLNLSDYVATWGVAGTRHYESTVVTAYYKLSNSSNWIPVDHNHVYGNTVEATFEPVADPNNTIKIKKYNNTNNWSLKVCAHRSIIFAN